MIEKESQKAPFYFKKAYISSNINVLGKTKLYHPDRLFKVNIHIL